MLDKILAKRFYFTFLPDIAHLFLMQKKFFSLESKSEKLWGKRCCVASAKPPSPPPLPQGKEEIAAAAAFASGWESLFQPVYFASQVASPPSWGEEGRHSGFAAASSSSPSTPNPTTAYPPPLGLEEE